MSEGHLLTVVVDARLTSDRHGGVEQVIIGLAHGLSALDGPEEYVFLAYEGQSAWLEPFVHGPARVMTVKRPFKSRLVRRFPVLAAARRRIMTTGATDSVAPPVPATDGTAEKLGAEVVHFPRQDGFITSIPTIFHPHDLQHVHFPEFFSDAERRQRDLWYRTLCDQASVVSVTSEWGKRDLVENLDVDPGKIAVVPLAPALAAYGPALDDQERSSLLDGLGVRGDFAFYPAQTWPHKNHARLVGALKLLRERGTDITLVCSGAKNEYLPALERFVRDQGMDDRVLFVGYVSPKELQALYAGARCMIMPTLFEAAGGFGPIAEAFLAGVPVACSNVTSIPEQVGDAALVFDPLDERAIAATVERLWTDSALRADLVDKGRQNIMRFSWDRTARTFRAHYRRLAGRNLNVEDVTLLGTRPEF